MSYTKTQVDSLGEAYLTLLADRGVDYLFGNSGTDFPSIIEAFAKAQAGGAKAPVPVTVPHENLAVAMAHGVFLATGRPQAVMFHVNVGTANGVCGVMNAAREQVPILFTAGRTPINEEGVDGARSVFIHWGQEMFDQAGMLREMVKWDYELRGAGQLESVVDRALTVAMSEPRGPVYLSLPREVLAEAPGAFSYGPATARQPASPPAPAPDAIAEAADLLANAENPVVITSGLGIKPETVPVFAEMAERFALPVVSFRPRYLNLPTDHPMHAGFDSAPFVKDADVILVIDSDVPWIPSLMPANPDAKVIHIGVDPLFQNLPIRGFPSHISMTAASSMAVPALAAALEDRADKMLAGADTRRARIAERRTKVQSGLATMLEKVRGAAPIETPWLTHCLNEALAADDILVSETQLPAPYLSRTVPGTYFGTPSAGGLGWGLGAALGIKLGAPDRTVVCALGDGAYMFNGPTPAHYVSRAMDLPVLTIIVNNGMWGSVRKATLGLYPDGAASKSNRAPLTVFDPAPDYEKVVEASGGHGERVEDPAELPAALERCLKIVREEGRQAVLNVRTMYSDSQALADSKR